MKPKCRNLIALDINGGVDEMLYLLGVTQIATNCPKHHHCEHAKGHILKRWQSHLPRTFIATQIKSCIILNRNNHILTVGKQFPKQSIAQTQPGNSSMPPSFYQRKNSSWMPILTNTRSTICLTSKFACEIQTRVALDQTRFRFHLKQNQYKYFE